jgi:hypothetical protein
MLVKGVVDVPGAGLTGDMIPVAVVIGLHECACAAIAEGSARTIFPGTLVGWDKVGTAYSTLPLLLLRAFRAVGGRLLAEGAHRLRVVRKLAVDTLLVIQRRTPTLQGNGTRLFERVLKADGAVSPGALRVTAFADPELTFGFVQVESAVFFVGGDSL